MLQGQGGPPLDPFFDMDTAGFLEYVEAAIQHLEGVMEAHREQTDAAGDAAGTEAETEAARLEEALARVRAARSVFSALPPAATRRPLALSHAEVAAVAAMAALPARAVATVLHDYARLRQAALVGAREQLDDAQGADAAAEGADGAEAGGDGGSETERAVRRLGAVVVDGDGGAAAAAEDERAAQRDLAEARVHFQQLSSLSLAGFEARLTDTLRRAAAAAPPAGRTRGASAAARARADARQIRAGLAVLGALPEKERRRLERQPDRPLDARAEAAAAAAARVPVAVVRSVVDGYRGLRLSAAQMLQLQLQLQQQRSGR